MMNSKTNLLLPGERLDDLGIGGYSLIQNPDYFCFGMDAVLLSSYIQAQENTNIIDLCTGNGIIPVLLAAKTPAKKIYGLEIQKETLDMGKRSVLYNNLSTRVELILGDLKKIKEIFPPNSFDVVSVNPPYVEGFRGLKNNSESINIARHEILCNFEDVISCARYLLKDKGHLYLVHRPSRLIDIVNTMSKGKIEPKYMRFVHPFSDKGPNLVLIEGIKGAKSELRIQSPLVVYNSNGDYTPEILKIYGYE